MKNIIIKNSIVIYTLLIGILLSSISCTSQIEVEMPNEKIDQSEVYKDLATTKAVLNNIYLDFSSSYIFSKSNVGPSFNLSLFTDELDYHGTNITSNDIYENSITDNNSYISSWWNNSYQNIYTINAFIEGVNGSSYLDSNLKKQFLGETYTLRALYYHYLTILFGDIPHTVSTDYNFNKSLKRLPYQEVLLKIESDLTSAIELLDYSNRDPNKFYINKSVAQIILIENYILQKKYDKAESTARLLLDQKQYSIEGDLSKTFKKGAKSTVWQIAPKFTMGVTSEASQYLFSNFTVNSTTITKKLLESFDDKDKRKKDWLNKITLNNEDFYQVYKYKNNQNNTDEFSIFYRIEQVYFQLAYSLFMQANAKQAIETLNIIRKERGLEDLPSTLNKQEFITNYLEESSREFFTENARRFIDLKINDKIDDLKLLKPNFQSYHNLMPIPYRQLEINKNLLPNNPGY
ncbi:RagB/SusD family nutrient uptake outer membrane protein [Myroides marinus]|uniref:RagB/SusD family nutrient uptake outer membrane protein n=1 Tax=Myroides marinus TaxID=703342 RepID=UPI0025751CAA|nr:RagB/SusD family nutrient uptake outer membrane protein [Myroides marinus]MDM1354813.1 RagB/SusD family nutrient uptake outer membrane protein [Myroides marinus]MDM1534380.1 RagB/SusD family nutrient uptake outer membrane protein [Myroides marinus]MDM1541336.1 RagB/SusD family nutrient uptake outer membrane protein [Myroides marinus]